MPCVYRKVNVSIMPDGFSFAPDIQKRLQSLRAHFHSIPVSDYFYNSTIVHVRVGLVYLVRIQSNDRGRYSVSLWRIKDSEELRKVLPSRSDGNIDLVTAEGKNRMDLLINEINKYYRWSNEARESGPDGVYSWDYLGQHPENKSLLSWVAEIEGKPVENSGRRG